jgi:CTP:molybdopterin cytidylyltransferase MocA
VTIAAVVLAAGGGSRFAGPTHKLLADFHGKPVVRWAIEHAAGAGCDDLVVVMGAVDLRPVLPAGVTVIDNPRWHEGQATSLQAAVRHGRRGGYGAIVVGLGDQPLVPPETWRMIAHGDGPLVSAVFDGQRSPPMRIGKELWPLLPSEGDEGARVLVRDRPDLLREIACPGHGLDIDTLEDLPSWS